MLWRVCTEAQTRLSIRLSNLALVRKSHEMALSCTCIMKKKNRCIIVADSTFFGGENHLKIMTACTSSSEHSLVAFSISSKIP